MKERRCIIK